MLCLIHGDRLSALFSLHDFICSKYVEKKKQKQKRRKHSAKIKRHVLDKIIILITFEVVFSVSNLGLRCCLSVLLVSVWPCFASMRHCALWGILGEEEPCAQGFGDDTDSLGFSEGWLEQKWKGCLIQNFLVFPLPLCNELCAGLFSQVLLPRDKYRAGEWLYWVSHPTVVLCPW